MSTSVLITVAFGGIPGAGLNSVDRAFVIALSTHQVLWVHVDVALQMQFNLMLLGETFDLLA